MLLSPQCRSTTLDNVKDTIDEFATLSFRLTVTHVLHVISCLFNSRMNLCLVIKNSLCEMAYHCVRSGIILL